MHRLGHSLHFGKKKKILATLLENLANKLGTNTDTTQKCNTPTLWSRSTRVGDKNVRAIKFDTPQTSMLQGGGEEMEPLLRRPHQPQDRAPPRRSWDQGKQPREQDKPT
jgi:hypothetical protein